MMRPVSRTSFVDVALPQIVLVACLDTAYDGAESIIKAPDQPTGLIVGLAANASLAMT